MKKLLTLAAVLFATVMFSDLNAKDKEVAIGDVLEDGVVWFISDDGSTAKVFSKTEGFAKYFNGAINVYDAGIASDQRKGAANTAAILAVEGYSKKTFPAFEWCESLGKGWYIPSRNELQDLFTVVLGDGAGKVKEGYMDLDFEEKVHKAKAEAFAPDAWYNSSTSMPNDKARLVKIQTMGDSGSVVKSGGYSGKSARRIRAIKEVSLK